MATSRFFDYQNVSTWRVPMLRQAILHYGGRQPRRAETKSVLIQRLNSLAEQQNLTADTGFAVWRALKEGRALPSRKPYIAPRQAVDTALKPLVTPRRNQRARGGLDRTQVRLIQPMNTLVSPWNRAAPGGSLARLGRESLPAGETRPSKPNSPNLPAATPTPETTTVVTRDYSQSIGSTEFVRSLAAPLDRPVSGAKTLANACGSQNSPPTTTNKSKTECIVCFGDLTLDNRPPRRISAKCEHEPDVCGACLRQSIASQFDSKFWVQIDCPSCGARLAHEDIKCFADSSVFGRYDNHTVEACLVASQFQRCRHEGCRSGQYCFPDEDSYIICRECNGRTCISCDTIWHPEVSCTDATEVREAAARTAENNAADQYIAENSKRCPRCEAPGEKVVGCDHMTCPRCRHEYCWSCLADYGQIAIEGNAFHEITCRHHTNNLPTHHTNNLPSAPGSRFQLGMALLLNERRRRMAVRDASNS